MSSTHKAQPSAKACLECRNKHLKCDSQTPTCGRCASHRTPCHYVHSRRGYRGPGRNTAHGARATSHPRSSYPCGDQHYPFPDTQQMSFPSDDMDFTGAGGDDESSCGATISIARIESDHTPNDDLIDLFYRDVHPAHPFVLPRCMYLENRQIFPSHLRAAICFIASHHSAQSSDHFRDEMDLVYAPTVVDDGFKVQTLLIVTLASYARFERENGNRALTAAIDIALRIGLNSNAFAIDQEPVLQESWRRTWWELYSISGLISLIGGTDLKLVHPNGMTLPTHCENYERCQVPHVGLSAEMQERFSADDTVVWSSFAYKVEAMRILRKVLDVASETVASTVHAANASISSFLLSIPHDKRDGLKDNEEIDEVMSCALMIIHLSNICLHYPRSGLADAPCSRTVCGTARDVVAVDQSRIHRAAALRSARALSELISARTSMRRLSPCFSCAIAFAAVVELSDCLTSASPESNSLKEDVQLQLAALNEIGKIWPIARVVRGQIAQFTREFLSINSSWDAFPGPAPIPALVEPDDAWLRDLMEENSAFPPQDLFMPGLEVLRQP